MEIKRRKPTIYLIGGKAKHGKDTFSSFLKEVYESNGNKLLSLNYQSILNIMLER